MLNRRAAAVLLPPACSSVETRSFLSQCSEKYESRKGDRSIFSVLLFSQPFSLTPPPTPSTTHAPLAGRKSSCDLSKVSSTSSVSPLFLQLKKTLTSELPLRIIILLTKKGNSTVLTENTRLFIPKLFRIPYISHLFLVLIMIILTKS